MWQDEIERLQVPGRTHQSPVLRLGGFERELPSHTSRPMSYAAKACEPVTPLDTQPTEVSSVPCMKNATSLAPV